MEVMPATDVLVVLGQFGGRIGWSRVVGPGCSPGCA